MQEKKNLGIELAERPAFLADLLDKVSHPDDLDAATAQLGLLPLLINPHLASRVDLSDLGLGHAVHLPVQISRVCGGRKSLHFLYPGEKALVGLYVTGEGVAFRYLTRETGHSLPARTGDEYSEELRSLRGELLRQRRGRLEVIDPEKGEGQIIVAGELKTIIKSWGWSFFTKVVISKDE